MVDALVRELYGAKLTERELEVFDLWIVELMSRKELALVLVVSLKTVESHIHHIEIKLGYEFHARSMQYPRVHLTRDYWYERGRREAGTMRAVTIVNTGPYDLATTTG